MSSSHHGHKLRRTDSAGMPEDMPLTKNRYGVGVCWEKKGSRDVDIDLQCVVVDQQGVIIDCAYYNNLKAVRCITHSGDETVSKPSHIKEIVWVNFNRMPANVSMLIFVIAAYSGGYLSDVTNGELHILEESESNEVADFDLEESNASVSVMAVIYRSPSGWMLRAIDEPARQGHHFMDILPLLCDTIRHFIPSAPTRQKVAFAMEKGSVMDLPQDMNSITVGLGWDVDEGEVDLDVSAVLLDMNGTCIEAVFFGRLESEEHGIKHTGDNLTGVGEGDDEQIVLRLAQIGPRVQSVVFVVNIYTKGKTFAQVANPYCRVVDDSSGQELCHYKLRDAGRGSGLMIARIVREVGDRWGFHALGLPCRGTMYKDSLPEIKITSQVKTSSLLQCQSSSHSLGHIHVHDGPPQMSLHTLASSSTRTSDQPCCTVLPPTGKRNSECALQ